MQRFIVETSPHDRDPGESEYRFLQRHHGVRKMKVVRFADSRIVIVRDPVRRIISLFSNKFVQRRGNSDIFESYRTVTGQDPAYATFRDFVLNYVSRLGEIRLDPHIWPQAWHLCPVSYDRVIELENLCEGMARLVGPDLAETYFRVKTNSAPVEDIDIDRETRSRIDEIYADDFRMLHRIKSA